MNTRNFSQKSNYKCGSAELDLLPFYVQTCNIPGMNFSLPEIGGRSGLKLNLSNDNVTFNSLSLTVIIDEDFQIYKEFTDIVFKSINLEAGSFANRSFDFWVEITDDMGKNVMKVEYSGCRIESIGDLELDSADDSTEHTFSVEIKFDYYKIIFPDSTSTPSLRI